MQESEIEFCSVCKGEVIYHYDHLGVLDRIENISCTCMHEKKTNIDEVIKFLDETYGGKYGTN